MIDAARDFATLQAFIVGRLSDDERRLFEERLAREPALVQELEQSLQMREGLQQLRTRGYFSNAVSQRKRFRAWVPALAAAASAALALFLWLSRASAPSPILTASLESHAIVGATSLVAEHFTFVSTRGNSVPDLDLPAAGLIEIRAEPSTTQTDQRYRVSLVRQLEGPVAEPIAALAGLAVSADGYLHCYAEAARLVPGIYVLRIQVDENDASVAETFSFNLRHRAADPSR